MHYLVRSLVLLMVSAGLSAYPAAAAEPIKGALTRIIDGDTFDFIPVRGEPLRIRVWGINAAERHEAGGAEATATLRSLIAKEGAGLVCEYRDVDWRHRRLVAQCWTENTGIDLGEELVRKGVARDCKRFSRGYYKHFESASVTLTAALFCNR